MGQDKLGRSRLGNCLFTNGTITTKNIAVSGWSSIRGSDAMSGPIPGGDATMGNNLNHPNDWRIRLYAQNILAAIME